MKKLTPLILACTVLCGSTLRAQNPENITGTWQGALKLPTGQQLRIVFKFSVDDDKLKAVMYSIDQQSPAIPANTFTREGANLKLAITAINGTYEGKISADGKSITGTFSQGVPLPLTLEKATAETAWDIPEPPPPPKLMPADAKPSFEVATIKPSRPEERFSLLVNPRNAMLNSTSTSVSDLIKFAYDVHPRQIAGGASWTETEKYDVTGKPDVEGVPNVPQLKMMLQKLLADRFQLKFHTEKRELNAYAISVTKTGATITKADPNPMALPGFAGGGPRGLIVRNATMAEFAGMLQATILDRPVVDQTGFGTTRYNFILKYTPDAFQAQAAGTAPNAPPPPDPADAPPDIYTAFQQQLGLELESVKTAVDVIVIDRIEKPSDN
jgi:uncharacterized protein (TIGR03435 family)